MKREKGANIEIPGEITSSISLLRKLSKNEIQQPKIYGNVFECVSEKIRIITLLKTAKSG